MFITARLCLSVSVSQNAKYVLPVEKGHMLHFMYLCSISVSKTGSRVSLINNVTRGILYLHVDEIVAVSCN